MANPSAVDESDRKNRLNALAVLRVKTSPMVMEELDANFLSNLSASLAPVSTLLSKPAALALRSMLTSPELLIAPPL